MSPSAPVDPAAAALLAASAPAATASAPDGAASGASPAASSPAAQASSPQAAASAQAAARAAAAAKKAAADKEKDKDKAAKNRTGPGRHQRQRRPPRNQPSAPRLPHPQVQPPRTRPAKAACCWVYQTCMSEQCAKPAFVNAAICVERRAIEQRREAERNVALGWLPFAANGFLPVIADLIRNL